RRIPRLTNAMGQDRCADVQCRQLVWYGAAFARQYRGVHARGYAAQEVAYSPWLARTPVLYRGGAARPDSFFRLLAQGRRQRCNERAAGEARHPQGSRRFRMAPRARMAAGPHALDQVLSRFVTSAAEDSAVRGRLDLAKSIKMASYTYAASSLGSMGST